jgi:23S rRNA (uridine2552-2'-O)-methyltransferase
MPRKKINQKWLEDHKRDHYYWTAKEYGYRSRAAFKLLEVLKRFSIIKKGAKVLDIGAAPGGWTQVAREAVGDTGLVVSVDTKLIEPFKYQNVKILNLDITSENTIQILTNISKDGFDVILSDVSPNISGAWEVDHYQQITLALKVIELTKSLLTPYGIMFIKLFDGPEVRSILDKVKKMFNLVKIIKPRASKVKSSEVYLLARGFNYLKDSQEPQSRHQS